MEESLVQLLSLHGVILYPSQFLSKCVVCNGSIQTQEDDEKKREIFQSHGCSFTTTPNDLMNLEVFQCTTCQQGYWWSDNPNSSASRVKVTAIYLFQQCLQGGIPYHFNTPNEEEQFCDFWGMDMKKQSTSISSPPQSTTTTTTTTTTSIQQQSENHNHDDEEDEYRIKGGIDEVMSWLKDPKLHHELELQSTYNINNNNDLPFTNVTYDFIGTLDYIFFEKNQFNLIGRFHVPTTLKELNNNQYRPGGHLLPSDIWPSDHLAIGAYIQLKNRQTTTTTDDNDKKKKTKIKDNIIHQNKDIDNIERMKRNGDIEPKDDKTMTNKSNPPIIPKTTILDSAYVLPELRNQMFVRIPTRKKNNKTKGEAHVSSEIRNQMFTTMRKKTQRHSTKMKQPISTTKKETISSSSLSSSTSTDSAYYVPSSEVRNNEVEMITTKSKMYVPKSISTQEDEKNEIKHDGTLNCGCGCIPKVKSLFEMAELRKQARLKKQKEKNATKQL